MKANELRVGNYTDKGMVKSFYEHGIHIGMGKCYLFRDLNPIPITEEVLLKCGFSDKGDSLAGYEYIKGLAYSVTKHGDYLAFRVYTTFSDKSVFIRRVRYLHELQNLYFAIEGEELEVEL